MATYSSTSVHSVLHAPNYNKWSHVFKWRDSIGLNEFSSNGERCRCKVTTSIIGAIQTRFIGSWAMWNHDVATIHELIKPQL